MRIRHILTLLQYVADQVCVSVLGGYMQRRTSARVSNQQADASTNALRQLEKQKQKKEDLLKEGKYRGTETGMQTWVILDLSKK